MTDLEKAIEEIKETYRIYFSRCKEIEDDKMPVGVMDGHNSEYKKASNILYEKVKEIEKKYTVKVTDKEFSIFDAYKIKKEIYEEIS